MAEGYEITRLPNGLRLIVAPMPDRYSATIAVYIGTGSRYESEAQAGSSHMIEHMLFKGTQRRPTAEDISEAIESVGGSLNASTDKEATVYWAKVAGEDVPLALDLLSDMLLHSRIDPGEVRKEKRVVAEELGMAMDAPQDWIHSLIEQTIWPGEPLGRDVAGTRASVACLTRAGLLRYLRRHYTPRATVVSIAGRVDPQRAPALVEQFFGAWQGGEAPTHPPGAYRPDRPRVRLEPRETEQCNLCLATKGLSHHDPRRHALDLLNDILGGGMSSRLFVQVRERLGLVYDIHSYADRLDDTGMLVTYAGMDPAACPQVIRAILAALRRLREEPVGQAELHRAKNQFRGRLLLGLEDTSSVANWHGAQELMLSRIRSPEEVLAGVYAVRAEDIQGLAAELVREEYLRLALIGPHDDERKFEELLHLP
jgi:predicted Zn-dependent peptidase